MYIHLYRKLKKPYIHRINILYIGPTVLGDFVAQLALIVLASAPSL